MFLTDAQVTRLTGEREKGAQIGWLKANGVRHWVNAQGKAVVPVSAIDAPWKPPEEQPGWSPDFSGVRQ